MSERAVRIWTILASSYFHPALFLLIGWEYSSVLLIKRQVYVQRKDENIHAADG